MTAAALATGSGVLGRGSTGTERPVVMEEARQQRAGEAAAPPVRPGAPEKNVDPEPPRRKRSELDILRERLAKAKARYQALQRQVKQAERQGGQVPPDLRDSYTSASIELASLEERVGWIEFQQKNRNRPVKGDSSSP